MSHDVFLSFNSSDREAARAIVAALKEQGLAVFLDEKELPAGQNFIPRLETSLLGCKSVAVLMGPRGLGKWQQIEKDFALDREAREPSLPVVPVLLPGDVDPPTGFLSLNTWIDLRSGVEDAGQIASLTAALRGLPPAEGEGAFNPRLDVCPYRGLLPFREEDREFYFGREPDVAALVERVRVREHAVVPVIGSSGSGKSSLVYAGLIPALRNPANGTPWEILTLRPLDTPLENLMRALSPPPENVSDAEKIASVNRSIQLLRDGEIRLSQLVGTTLERSGGCQRLLLFIDQWEEIYSQMPRDVPEAERRKAAADRILFIDALLEAAKHDACTLVFTVRADFYDPLLGWDNLLKNGTLQDHLNRAGLSLGPMGRDALRDCVVKPADKAGYRFADGLVEVIVDEVGLQPGQLPLLEFYLRELWLRRDGEEFTFQGHKESGGVSGAIAQRADHEFATLIHLDKSLEEAARRVFVSLVTPGEGQEDTRAVIALPESGPERRVVEFFSAHDVRLLTADDGKVEVSHEALIRQWKRLQDDWLRKNRDFLRVRDRIRAARDLWDSSPKKESKTADSADSEAKPKKMKKERRRSPDRLLSPGLPLQEAKDLLKNHGDVLIDDIRDYIRLSLRRARWRRVRSFVVVPMLAVFGLLLVFGTSYGIHSAWVAAAVSKIEENEREAKLRQENLSSPTPGKFPPLEDPSQARPSFTNSIGMQLVWCPPGRFTMGSPQSEAGRYGDEAPHKVTLTDGFYLGRYEVTQAQWTDVKTKNPSQFSEYENWQYLPVEYVSWNDAKEFCEELTNRERNAKTLPDDWEYRLPTEAQWEYACRAGTSTPFSFGRVLDGRQANCDGSNSYGTLLSGPYLQRTTVVGTYRPNPWGFHDMHGNVWEWCQDWYSFLGSEQATDPEGSAQCGARVIRGGSWYYTASYCRSANRFRNTPVNRANYLGLRPACVPVRKSAR